MLKFLQYFLLILAGAGSLISPFVTYGNTAFKVLCGVTILAVIGGCLAIYYSEKEKEAANVFAQQAHKALSENIEALDQANVEFAHNRLLLLKDLEKIGVFADTTSKEGITIFKNSHVNNTGGVIVSHSNFTEVGTAIQINNGSKSANKD
ncbi:MAG: hypothetical protein EOO91_02290 [Pedobacter sp.]|nr:MAG: hypothetical protein EOO91_02290 [Pedobacter sp.]